MIFAIVEIHNLEEQPIFNDNPTNPVAISQTVEINMIREGTYGIVEHLRISLLSTEGIYLGDTVEYTGVPGAVSAYGILNIPVFATFADVTNILRNNIVCYRNGDALPFGSPAERVLTIELIGQAFSKSPIAKRDLVYVDHTLIYDRPGCFFTNDLPVQVAALGFVLGGTRTSMVLQIENSFHADSDVLTFSTADTNILGEYDSKTGTLTFSSVSPEPASVYQLVLRSVHYANTGGESGRKIIRILDELDAYRELHVNGPKMSVSSSILPYLDKPLRIFKNFSVVMPQSMSIQSATIVIHGVDVVTMPTPAGMRKEIDYVSQSVRLSTVDQVTREELIRCIQQFSYRNNQFEVDPFPKIFELTLVSNADDLQSNTISVIVTFDDSARVLFNSESNAPIAFRVENGDVQVMPGLQVNQLSVHEILQVSASVTPSFDGDILDVNQANVPEATTSSFVEIDPQDFDFVQRFLRSVTFRTTSQSTAPRKVTFSVYDGYKTHSVSRTLVPRLGTEPIVVGNLNLPAQLVNVSQPDSLTLDVGICLVSTDSSNGRWQYNTESIWVTVYTVTEQTGLLLAPGTLLRFVPNTDFTGKATANFYGWDQTDQLEPETRLDTTVRPESISLLQSVLTAIVYPITRILDVETDSGTVDAENVNVSSTLRLDGGAPVTGARVQIQKDTYSSDEDLLSFVDTGGISGSWDGTTGTLTLSGASSEQEYQTALRSVTYTNLKLIRSASQKIVSLVVANQKVESEAASRTLKISESNALSVTSGSSYVPVGKPYALSDLGIRIGLRAITYCLLTFSVKLGEVNIQVGNTGCIVVGTKNPSQNITVRGTVKQLTQLMSESDGAKVSYISKASGTENMGITLRYSTVSSQSNVRLNVAYGPVPLWAIGLMIAVGVLVSAGLVAYYVIYKRAI